MKIKTTLAVSATMAAMVFLAAGCKKSGGGDEAGATSGGSAAPPAPAPPSPGGTDEVTTYPNATPYGGTVRLLQPFQVHTAADPASKTLTGLQAGTLVDLKASYSNWMMIMWPCGVAQLCPGWIELRNVQDTRVQQVVKDAGVDAPVIIDASPDVGVPVPDAGAPARDGGRPSLKIPPRKTN